MAGATGKSANSAESTPQGGAATTDAVTSQPETTADTPTWVSALLESNAAVVASNSQLKELLDGLILSNDELKGANEAVVAGIEAFKANAGELITQIVDGAKQSVGAPAVEERKTVAVYDQDADYVVASGQKFVDRHTTKLYSAGDVVSHMGEGRMQKLLDLGIIEEA